MSDEVRIPAMQGGAAACSSFSLPPSSLPQPVPRVPVTTRAATMADLPFIDALQKAHTYMVGWMPRKQIEGKIAAGQVIVAEVVTGHSSLVTCGGSAFGESPASDKGQVTNDADVRVGYLIAHDQYMKRDDVGIVYQVNVQPMRQRHLVGAALIRAAFERAAYGCRLYCCWCAQDIRANYFWESLGFLPLAFRTGARGQQRTHIFWQRRVRADDTTTPYWFPAETNGGAMREGRIVIPIPPGTHWRDAMPVLLPEVQQAIAPPAPKALPPTRPPPPAVPTARRMAIVRSQSKHLGGLPPGKAAILTAGGVRYVDRGDYVPEPVPVAPPKPKRAPRQAAKNDPKHLAAARELRDRYLEHFNDNSLMLTNAAKYEVGRHLGTAVAASAGGAGRLHGASVNLLPAA